MPRLSRKQREIRQREELILKIARRLLVKDGYFGLSMDRIAGATEYAKGTIYQHFRSKEDVLAGIMVSNLERRADLLATAATFPGSTRERMAVVLLADELHCRLHPDHVRAAEIIEIASFIDRAAAERRIGLATWRHRNLSIIQGIVRDAVAAGDLDGAVTRESTVLIAIEGLMFGARTLADNDRDGHLGITDVHDILRTAMAATLDGFGWRALSTEWDYPATIRRASTELFSNEAKRAGRT